MPRTIALSQLLYHVENLHKASLELRSKITSITLCTELDEILGEEEKDFYLKLSEKIHKKAEELILCEDKMKFYIENSANIIPTKPIKKV